jgi:hypothetical protein
MILSIIFPDVLFFDFSTDCPVYNVHSCMGCFEETNILLYLQN